MSSIYKIDFAFQPFSRIHGLEKLFLVSIAFSESDFEIREGKKDYIVLACCIA